MAKKNCLHCVLIFFSATNALTGDGLQEGVDWLQGMMGIHISEGESGCVIVSSAHHVVWLTFCYTVNH